jgi:hypothetical protein
MDARDRQATELIRQSQQEKAEAVRLLAELYGRIVLAICQSYLPEREAQKIAEQTFDEFVRGNYEDNSVYVSLLTIARRLSKARERAIGIEQFINSNGQNPGVPLSPKDKEDRMLLCLRLDLKLPWAAIAKIMGIPSPKAAKQRGYNLGRRLKESKNVPRGT